MADLTELVDIDPERVDLVKNPANGFPILVMKAVNAKGDIDEKPDIAGARSVIQQLARLIQSEASELATGALDEICDLHLLLQAADLMHSFLCLEQMGSGDMTAAKQLFAERASKESGASSPPANDTAKDADVADQNEDKTPETPESQVEPPVEKSAGELLDEAVAKAVTPLQEVIKGLEAEMAVLKSTPVPGGPAVTTTATASEGQRAQSLAKAAYHERLAKTVGDRELVRYHEEKAKEARRAANG